MNTQGWKIADGGWPARSALECGSPRPLSTNATSLYFIGAMPAGNKLSRLRKP